MLRYSKDLRVEGVAIRDSNHWTITTWGSDRIHIHSINILNYRVNTDGVDVCTSSDVTIEQSNVMSGDDCISPKGAVWFCGLQHNAHDLERLTAHHNLLMSGAVGNGIRIEESVVGVPPVVGFMRDMLIHDNSFALASTVALIQPADQAVLTRLDFNLLRIERYFGYVSLLKILAPTETDYEYTGNSIRGRIFDVFFRDLRVYDVFGAGASFASGLNDTYAVSDVTWEEGYVVEGQTRLDLAQNVYNRSFTSNLALIPLRNVTDLIATRDFRPIASPMHVRGTTGAATEITLQGEEINQQQLSWELVTPARQGSVSVTAQGVATYTPTDFAWRGCDLFVVRASDGALWSNLATVWVNVDGTQLPPPAVVSVSVTKSVTLLPPAQSTTTQPGKDRHRGRTIGIAVGVSVGVAMLAVAVLTALLVMRRRKQSS